MAYLIDRITKSLQKMDIPYTYKNTAKMAGVTKAVCGFTTFYKKNNFLLRFVKATKCFVFWTLK